MFQIHSGLKVNYDKTEIMPLGPIKNNYRVLLPDHNFRWHSGPIKSLGVFITHDINNTLELNYGPVVRKVENVLKLWKKRDLTIYGKIVVLNSFVLSQYIYLLSVLPTPKPEYMKYLETNLFKYIWNNKPDKIKRVFLKQNRQFGGVNMPDICTKDMALKIAWIPRLMKSGEKLKNLLLMCMPCFSSDFLYCNINSEDMHKITGFASNIFTKHVLQYWFEYNFKKPVSREHILSQFLWFNSFIRIGNNVAFFRDVYQKGIKYLYQLCDATGRLLSYVEFSTKYNMSVNFIKYFGLLSAIPSSWKTILNNGGPNIDLELHVNNNVCKKVGVPEGATKLCKIFYNNMLKNVENPIVTLLNRWATYFPEMTEQNLLNSFTNIYEITACCKLQYFQYKLLHRIVVTNEKLCLWGIVDNDLCNFCFEEIESMCHLFF